MERVGFRASDFADNYNPRKKFMRLYTVVYKSGFCSIPISAPIGLFSQSLSHMLLSYLRSEICYALPCTSFELQRNCKFLVANVLGIDFLSLC